MAIIVNVSVDGPGLVVNGPALVIRKALLDAGYSVDIPDWPGLEQWPQDYDGWSELSKTQQSLTIKVEVSPQPWGG